MVPHVITSLIRTIIISKAFFCDLLIQLIIRSNKVCASKDLFFRCVPEIKDFRAIKISIQFIKFCTTFILNHRRVESADYHVESASILIVIICTRPKRTHGIMRMQLHDKIISLCKLHELRIMSIGYLSSRHLLFWIINEILSFTITFTVNLSSTLIIRVLTYFIKVCKNLLEQSTRDFIMDIKHDFGLDFINQRAFWSSCNKLHNITVENALARNTPTSFSREVIVGFLISIISCSIRSIGLPDFAATTLHTLDKTFLYICEFRLFGSSI